MDFVIPCIGPVLKNANPEGVHNLEEKVYKPIKMSYDLLKGNDVKYCFLICSLFPEDHEIRLFDLICYGIREGNPWAKDNQRNASLNVFFDSFIELKSRGLLQDSDRFKDGAIMPHIVRDVAINIAKESGFLIKTGLGFTDWPQFEEENLKGMEWISLMENSLKDITYQPQNIQGTSIDIIKPEVFSSLHKLEALFMHGSFCDWKASNEEDGDCVAFEELATLRHLYALHVDIKDEYIISDKYTLVECFPAVQHFSFRSRSDTTDLSKSVVYNGYSESFLSDKYILVTPNLFNLNLLSLRQNIQNIAKWLKILLEKTTFLELIHVYYTSSVDALIEPDTIKHLHNLESQNIRVLKL